MNLYKFLLPAADNRGASYAIQIDLWELAALSIAGGYTDSGLVKGEWSPHGGTICLADTLRAIEVACTPEVAARLGDIALSLFDDQLSIFSACIGEAKFYERKRVGKYEFSEADRLFHGARVSARREANRPW